MYKVTIVKIEEGVKRMQKMVVVGQHIVVSEEAQTKLASLLKANVAVELHLSPCNDYDYRTVDEPYSKETKVYEQCFDTLTINDAVKQLINASQPFLSTGNPPSFGDEEQSGKDVR